MVEIHGLVAGKESHPRQLTLTDWPVTYSRVLLTGSPRSPQRVTDPSDHLRPKLPCPTSERS
jgi:hypothetical protein